MFFHSDELIESLREELEDREEAEEDELLQTLRQEEQALLETSRREKDEVDAMDNGPDENVAMARRRGIG